MTQRRIWPYLLILGWGSPMPIVIISSAVTQDAYTGNNTGHCWISTGSGLIWSFLGPIYFVLIINTVILIASAIRIGTARKDMAHIKKLKSVLYSAVILTPVLGLPWVVSLAKIITFGIEHQTVQDILDRVVDWSFICLNAPCGLLFLLIVSYRFREFRKSNKKKPLTRGTSVPVSYNTIRGPRPVPSCTANAYKKKPPTIFVHSEKPEDTIFASNLMNSPNKMDKDKLGIPVGNPPRPNLPTPTARLFPQSTLDYEGIKCDNVIFQNPTFVSIEDLSKISNTTEDLHLELETCPMEENIYQNLATVEQGPKTESYSKKLHDLAIPNLLFEPLDQIEIDVPLTEALIDSPRKGLRASLTSLHKKSLHTSTNSLHAKQIHSSTTSLHKRSLNVSTNSLHTKQIHSSATSLHKNSCDVKSRVSTTFVNLNTGIDLEDKTEDISSRASPSFERDEGFIRRSLKRIPSIFKVSQSATPPTNPNPTPPTRPPPPVHVVSKAKATKSLHHNNYLEHLHKLYNEKQQDSTPMRPITSQKFVSTPPKLDAASTTAPELPAPYSGKKVRDLLKKFDSVEATSPVIYATVNKRTKTLTSPVIGEQPPPLPERKTNPTNPFMTTSFTLPSQESSSVDTASPKKDIFKATETSLSETNSFNYLEFESSFINRSTRKSRPLSRSIVTIEHSLANTKNNSNGQVETPFETPSETPFETPSPSSSSTSVNNLSECNVPTSPSHGKLSLSLPESSLDSKLPEPCRDVPEQVDSTSSTVSVDKIPENTPVSPQTEETIPPVQPVVRRPDFTEQPSRKRVATNPENVRSFTSPTKIILRPRPRLPQEDKDDTGIRSASSSPVKRTSQFRPISSYSSDQDSNSNSTSNSTSPTKPLAFNYKPSTDLTKFKTELHSIYDNTAPVIARKPQLKSSKSEQARSHSYTLPRNTPNQDVTNNEPSGAFSTPQTQKPEQGTRVRSTTVSSNSNRLSGSFDNQPSARKRSNSRISDKIAFFDTASQGDTKSLPRSVKKSVNQSTFETTSPVKGLGSTSDSQMKQSKSFDNFSTTSSMEESDKRKSGLISPPYIKSPPIFETPQSTDL